jgi:Flp pilus assembly protein TadD
VTRSPMYTLCMQPSVAVDVASFTEPLTSRSVGVQVDLTGEQKAGLEQQLKDLEATLQADPDDVEALEAAAVTATNLGQYAHSEDLLVKLTALNKDDPQIWRLLAEVRPCGHKAILR